MAAKPEQKVTEMVKDDREDSGDWLAGIFDAADEDVMRRARGIAAHSERSSERSVRDGRNVQVFFSWTTGPAAFILRLPFPIGFKPSRVPFEPTGVSPSGRRSPIGARGEPATRLKAG